MGAKSLGTLSPEELDQTFLGILSEQLKAATDEAAACTASIFSLTSNYVAQPEFETLQQFYDLYFTGDIDEKKNAINQEVDDIFEQLQAQQARGEELKLSDEDEDKKKARLSLAAIQKKLETLITMDAGIRSQILPALSSMQCEDAIRQRVEHLVYGWSAIIQSSGQKDFEPLMRDLATKMSSIEESSDYYTIVFNEKAPEGVAARSVFIEF